MIRKLLQVLRPHDIKLRDAAWDERLGAELVTVLRRARVLHGSGLADWFDCGGAHCGERRRVLEMPGGPNGKPYLALCAIDSGCLDLPLSEDELRLSTLSFAGAIELLRAALRIDGVGDAAQVAPDVFHLGVTDGGGMRAEAFLALNPDLESFPYFLTARGTAQRASVVFTNTTRWLPQQLVDLHGPGRRVEIALLEDVLTMRDGAIVSIGGKPAAPIVTTAAPVCIAIDNDGERALSSDEYRYVIEAAPRELDLFLDFSIQHRITNKRTVYRGGRVRDGQYQPIEIRVSEAAVAAELIERTCRGGPYVKVRELHSMHDHDRQTFNRAWQQLDPEPRVFLEKQPGSRDVDAAFRFRAPPGRRWALLKPAV
jgi:hypothetical protein